MCSSLHVDNRKQDILICSKGPELDDATFTAEKEYSINFTEQHKKVCISLNYNRVISYIFANGVEIYKFESKYSEINAAPLCLGNISKDFSVDNIKKSVMKKYDLMKKYDSLFGFFSKMFIRLHNRKLM